MEKLDIKLEKDMSSFHDFRLYDRLLQAIDYLKWKKPISIQEKAIPLMLEGKSILAISDRCMGKTGAFLIPVIHQIMERKQSSFVQETTVLIVAPNEQLCKQIFKRALDLSCFCRNYVICCDISSSPVDSFKQRLSMWDKPDIVIGTPESILAHLLENNFILRNSLRTLVIDEIDLLLSVCHGSDVSTILTYLPTTYQLFLVSTTSQIAKNIKNIPYKNLIVLKDPELPGNNTLTQYYIQCEEKDKFDFIYALFALRHLKGNSLIFVSSVDRCYLLQLYLEQLDISSLIINSELPAFFSQVIKQFDASIGDVIITATEQFASEFSSPVHDKLNNCGVKTNETDFQSVSNIIYFDFPSTVNVFVYHHSCISQYKTESISLSFVTTKDVPLLKQIEHYFSQQSCQMKSQFKPYQLDMKSMELLRNRAREAFQAVAMTSFGDVRLKNMEILKVPFVDDRNLQLVLEGKLHHAVNEESHLRDKVDCNVPQTQKKSVKQQLESGSGVTSSDELSINSFNSELDTERFRRKFKPSAHVEPDLSLVKIEPGLLNVPPTTERKTIQQCLERISDESFGTEMNKKSSTVYSSNQKFNGGRLKIHCQFDPLAPHVKPQRTVNLDSHRVTNISDGGKKSIKRRLGWHYEESQANGMSEKSSDIYDCEFDKRSKKRYKMDSVVQQTHRVSNSQSEDFLNWDTHYSLPTTLRKSVKQRLGWNPNDSISNKVKSNECKPGKQYEMDPVVLDRRQKQIDYGKNSMGYRAYLKAVPRSKRTERDLYTPPKHIVYSRRSWDAQIKVWRKKLHEYDPKSNEEDEAIETDLSEMLSIINS